MRRRQFHRQLLCAVAAPGLGAASAVRAQAGAERLWFVFLETGRATPPDREAVMAMQRGHIDNFKRLFALGRLTGAGPLRDPSGRKRGIVVVRAASPEDLRAQFEPDEYVREGYMTLNAVPASAQPALRTEGIDASRVEELRIVQLARPAAPPDTAAALSAAQRAHLQGLVDGGRFGAWYTLQTGPVAEVLFARSTDSAAIEAALAGLPGREGLQVQVWPQWLSPGVVP